MTFHQINLVMKVLVHWHVFMLNLKFYFSAFDLDRLTLRTAIWSASEGVVP